NKTYEVIVMSVEAFVTVLEKYHVEMALSRIGGSLYRNVTKRFSTLFLAAVVGAFVFDLALNRSTDFYWDMKNKGKQWKDIKQRQLQ
uniref:Cytochrome b-c1 complex subunit 9 n=2 Tax=Parascaris univalens TaxID=6257 RepID=A0A915BZZ8_PARUN